MVQTDLKRVLAYSSIANAGYVLIGFAAAGVDDKLAAHRGLESALFFLLIYTFMTIGAFAVVTLVGRRSHDAKHGFDEYRGLARRSPVLAGFLTFFLLAQAGVPLTGGFVAKLEVFGAAIDAQEYGLAIVGVLSAVVLAFFYLRMTVVVFEGDDEAGEPTGPRRRLGAGRGSRCSWPAVSWCCCSASCPAPSCTSPATPPPASNATRLVDSDRSRPLAPSQLRRDGSDARSRPGARTLLGRSADLRVAAPPGAAQRRGGGAWPHRRRRSPARRGPWRRP